MDIAADMTPKYLQVQDIPPDEPAVHLIVSRHESAVQGSNLQRL